MGRVHLVIDAANVVGSRPDGWWRDRPGAARRLVESIAGAVDAGRLETPMTVVLEGTARAGVESGPFVMESGALCVMHAERDGDSAIVSLVERLSAGEAAEPEILVVTADRGLRARVTALGAQFVGPGWLHNRL